ncbi:ABC transporter ATP-binding protein [Lacipirellula sp.]|uniref:ABC transporter ATP-binding protein n=1 Tax=Lacipirellula sp. TaxID=2691419 RepID=UPI003D0C1A5B
MTTTATQPVLTAAGLRKAYGSGTAAVHAVAGIDVDLLPGEILAIMGASGSGKTTLLHLLAGLIRPDSGSIRLDGVDVAAASDARITALRRERIGVVFQAYNLMPTMSVLDNVALPLLLAGSRRSHARAVAAERLAAVGMESFAKRRPPLLSGGEQQRVAIARALVSNPQVVLADEPTGNLDRKNVLAVCKLLRQVATADGRAVAVVTHEPMVAAYADRIIVLADGRISDQFQRSEVGSVEQLATRCFHAVDGPA